LPPGLDLLIEDELNHPSLLWANALRHSYPVISLVHHLRSSEKRPGWQNAFYRLVEKQYLRSVDGYIFNSHTTRSVVAGLVGDRLPVLVAYPPTDRFGAALSADVVKARALEPGPLRIVFLGNVISRKGLETLLQAVGRQHKPIELEVIGSLTTEPAYASAMQRLAAGLGQSVRFHGPLDNGELTEKLRRAHLLAVPSSYEGFGIVYLEGMAFGLPAIGASTGAASEIISDGETGYLVRPGDDKTLAERLAGLHTDRQLLSRLSLNALQRYQQQPGWNETAGNIRRFLQKFV
jgi:glycosyltransferase involved in cell wall biosynthesis